MPAATPATMTRPSPGQGGCDDWRDRAACRGTDPELFFPVGSVGPALVQLGRAKQLCASCPVRTECLEWALANDQETGVWGGTNEDERRALRRARQAGARADAGGTAALHTQAALRPMDEGLIQAHVLAARAVCARMTGARLHALHDSGQRAAGLRAGCAWQRRAAAHAEMFTLLAAMTDDPAAASVLLEGAGAVHHLMLTAGPAANGMIAGSHQRLLACLRAGDADGAALEMEGHLRTLVFMWRMAQSGRGHRRLA